MEITKNKEAYMGQVLNELTEIQKNITILKPLFKKFIVIRGFEKSNYQKAKSTANNIIKINEDENSLKILIPKSIINENNINNFNNFHNNALSQEIIKIKDCAYENHVIFYDEVFTLYENKLLLLDNIIKNNNQEAVINKDVSSIFSAYFNKSISYNDKDKKDLFCLYISDQIKLTQQISSGENSNNLDSKINLNLNNNNYNNNKQNQIAFNINFIIALEKQIKEFSPKSAFEASCFLISKNELIPYASFKINENKDPKKFDFNIIKFDSAKANAILEKNKRLDSFALQREKAKEILINKSEIELSSFNSENYFFSENFINFLSKYNREFYGIYIKITCLKNGSELKFLYSDINQSAINNEIIKKLIEASNKNTKKVKTVKKIDSLNNENKLLHLVLEKIDLSNVKHSCCFIDMDYDLDLDLDSEAYCNLFACKENNDEKGAFIIDDNLIENNLNKENFDSAYEERCEAKNKALNKDLSKSKHAENDNFYKNSFSRSNSFNKGTNINKNNISKDDFSLGKIKTNNINDNRRISPYNNFRKNSNTNSNNNSNNLKSQNNLNNIKSRDNSNNRNNKSNLINFKNNENLNAKEKIMNNNTKSQRKNAFENIKSFDKNIFSFNSDNEISNKNINENKSKFKDLMDIEVLSIKDSIIDFKAKNETSAFLNNLDSFGKSHNNNVAGKKSKENYSKQLQADKHNFNFDYKNFEEIVKYYKQK